MGVVGDFAEVVAGLACAVAGGGVLEARWCKLMVSILGARLATAANEPGYKHHHEDR